MSRGAKVSVIVVVLLVFFVIVGISLSGRLPSGSVLVLRASGPIENQEPPGLFPLSGRTPALYELADAITAAKDDSRIAGLVVDIRALGAGWASVQELRARIADFRASGKPSICYLGADFAGNKEYYLATACGEVWMVPTSTLGIGGMMSQSLFFRGTFDKLGIYPDMYHIAEYKAAKNQFTEKKYTAAHREMAESITRSVYENYVADAAQARQADPAQFRAWLEQGPYLVEEALERKLVDRAAYADELRAFFEEKHQEWKPVELSRYKDEIPNDGRETIAVVHATGAIAVGKSDYSEWAGFTMGSDSVAADLRRAREDDAVKAIILRVDSPGGSAVASEIIRREVQKAREAGKPVVASMADVAGSGGYWISMSADKIVAEPSTITASIGVVFGKMNVSGLYNLLGLSVDHVVTAENATFLWEQQNFTPAQREKLQKLMRAIYDNFVEGVAAGRNMTPAAVDKIGKGRVWTGAQAKDLGLVDELGGFERALALAKELAGIPAEAGVRIVRYPKIKSLWQTLLSGEVSLGDMVGADPAARLAAELRRRAELREPIQVRMPFDLRIR